MAIIANAEVRTLAEPWSGEVRSGHTNLLPINLSLLVDKIKGLHLMILFVLVLFLVL